MPLFKLPEWLIVATKGYMFVKEISSSTAMGTTRCLPNSLWVQLRKFASLISWPLWLENWQSWTIKIRAEFIIQVSLVLSEGALHEGQNHLLCGDKISGFRNWWIEAWMSADSDRVKISRLSWLRSKSCYKKLSFFVFCVLEINGLSARDTPSSSTCNISATSCWVLKSKGTPLKLDSLRFKAHKKLDGSTGLFEFFFMAMLRLMARNIGDKVLDSEGTLFQRVGITLKICKMELA